MAELRGAPVNRTDMTDEQMSRALEAGAVFDIVIAKRALWAAERPGVLGWKWDGERDLWVAINEMEEA